MLISELKQRKPPIPLSDQEKETMLRLWDQKVRPAEIARMINRNGVTVHKFLKKALNLKTTYRWDREYAPRKHGDKVDKVIRLNGVGQSIEEIARATGLSPQQVFYILKRAQGHHWKDQVVRADVENPEADPAFA
jgi:IS30 family transposase